MEDARSKFASAEKLVKSGDISNERYVELEKAWRARQAAYEATRDEVRTQIASIKALQAEVKLAQKHLNDTVIRSPFDGAVAQKMVSVGQFIKDNTAVLSIVKTNPMRLRVDIPETAAGTVRVGTTLTFVTDALPGGQFHAVVRELNPALDSKSRSLSAEARLTDTDPRLRPGMFVQVQLVLAKANGRRCPQAGGLQHRGVEQGFRRARWKSDRTEDQPGHGNRRVRRSSLRPGERRRSHRNLRSFGARQRFARAEPELSPAGDPSCKN